MLNDFILIDVPKTKKVIILNSYTALKNAFPKPKKLLTVYIDQWHQIIRYLKILISPYVIALECLESDRYPAVIEHQHPEIGDAVQLLVACFDEGDH